MDHFVWILKSHRFVNVTDKKTMTFISQLFLHTMIFVYIYRYTERLTINTEHSMNNPLENSDRYL